MFRIPTSINIDLIKKKIEYLIRFLLESYVKPVRKNNAMHCTEIILS